MNISVVIPYMESDEGKMAVLNRLLDSLEDKGANEILVVENWKAGYAVPINFGLSQALGDYLMVMNDDLIFREGTLDLLTDPNAVTSPLVDGRAQSFWGCCFCIPRWVYEKIGSLWEGYRISYFDDDDYINILRQNDIPMHSVQTVNVENVDGGGRTLHTFPDHREFFEENRQTFIHRWGGLPDEVTRFFNTHNRLPKKGEL